MDVFEFVMEKIVYLTGAGTSKAEMSLQGIECDISMPDIGRNVLKMSRDIGGEYWRLHQEFALPEDQDIELMMSLLEGFDNSELAEFKNVCHELRRLFRSYLVSQIVEKKVTPNILSSLLYLHQEYGDDMGLTGEELTGVLTINYDSFLEEAFQTVHGGINCGHAFTSDTYLSNESVPPLLKLHGSFNWRIDAGRLEISKAYENISYEDDYSGWMPPSVYKRPTEGVIRGMWFKAAELLADCDVLRVIGSSLRNEDFALLSLIFTSQLRSRVFSIQLIVPDTDALGEEGSPGIMQRLPFLGKVKNFSTLPEFDISYFIGDNVFRDWVLMKYHEIERKREETLDDEFLAKTLLEGVA